MTEVEVVDGCEYCRDKATCLDKASGLIDGLASAQSGIQGILLLECPMCSQYYVYHSPEGFFTPLTAEEAAACFPDDFRLGRPDGCLKGCTWGTPSAPRAMPPAWRTSTVVALAKQMYESRDFSAMPILADALEDAGCASDDMLAHCRDPKATHVRGCWVVDLVLGKE